MKRVPLVCVLWMVCAACGEGAALRLVGGSGNVTPDVVVDASIEVLDEEGYRVIETNRQTGYVNTHWLTDTVGDGRTRVTVLFNRNAQSLVVQMYRQDPADEIWMTTELTEADQDRRARILRAIDSKIRIYDFLGGGSVVIGTDGVTFGG